MVEILSSMFEGVSNQSTLGITKKTNRMVFVTKNSYEESSVVELYIHLIIHFSIPVKLT